MTTVKPVKADIKQVVTDKIIALLEAGGNTYRKRWTESAASGFPKSGVTGKAYKGVNVLLLWGEAQEKGYTSPVWLTFKQAQSMGAMVRKGQKATTCVYFSMIEDKEKFDSKGDPAKFAMLKPFWLFNVAQIDGLPESVTQPGERGEAFNPIEAAEAMLNASGAVINYGGNKAYFRPSTDDIQLPHKEQFNSPEAFYSTALHELTHWTGHETRLKREFGARFGDNAYAFEELIAELGSSFVCGHLGFVDNTLPYHAAYLESWLTVLRNDKNAIFTACKQAGLAYDYVLAKAGIVATPEIDTVEA